MSLFPEEGILMFLIVKDIEQQGKRKTWGFLASMYM